MDDFMRGDFTFCIKILKIANSRIDLRYWRFRGFSMKCSSYQRCQSWISKLLYFHIRAPWHVNKCQLSIKFCNIKCGLIQLLNNHLTTQRHEICNFISGCDCLCRRLLCKIILFLGQMIRIRTLTILTHFSGGSTRQSFR